VWRTLADEPLVDAVVDEYDWRTPLAVAAGLNYLVLSGRASWDDLAAALAAHPAFLRRFVAEQSIQTNEVQRSWMLLPCFLEVTRRTGARTLELVELGPSGGLNLVWDRYRYRYEAGTWGSADAPLELAADERRPVPAELLALRPVVVSRVGVDRDPVDVTTEEGARLLKSFVWPDQTWRLELLERAIAALRADPPALVRGDLVAELPRLLDAPVQADLTLVYQTAVLGYLAHDEVSRVWATLDAAAAKRPLAYVGTHAPAPDVHTYYGLAVRVWPQERELVAHADFHGAWLDWLG